MTANYRGFNLRLFGLLRFRLIVAVEDPIRVAPFLHVSA